jgi:hypothetical protein
LSGIGFKASDLTKIHFDGTRDVGRPSYIFRHRHAGHLDSLESTRESGLVGRTGRRHDPDTLDTWELKEPGYGFAMPQVGRIENAAIYRGHFFPPRLHKI